MVTSFFERAPLGQRLTDFETIDVLKDDANENEAPCDLSILYQCVYAKEVRSRSRSLRVV